MADGVKWRLEADNRRLKFEVKARQDGRSLWRHVMPAVVLLVVVGAVAMAYAVTRLDLVDLVGALFGSGR